MDPRNFLEQEDISQGPRGGRPRLGGAVAAGGDEPTVCRTEGAADSLDLELIAVFVDELQGAGLELGGF